MLSFKTFLAESTEAEGAKLKHIHHAEDRPLFHGAKGFEHAHAALSKAHEHLASGKNDHTVTTKYDGSPSVVYGHHPETGKFFVASKSAFNKNPKINYSHEDIQKNHGHAPGLADKLSAALEHLPKVAPKKGVFQGDLMHQGQKSQHNPKGDVTVKGKKASYTPNTITYSHSGAEAEKVKNSRLGIVTHTQYHGKDLSSMTAKPLTSNAGFKQHADVHQQHPTFDASKASYSSEHQKKTQEHLAAAKQIHDTHGKKMYSAIHPSHAGEGGHLGTYINQTVRTGETPSHQGLQKHIQGHYEKAASKLKTPANQAKKRAEGAAHVEHIEKNKEHYSNLLKMHSHLQAAKNTMVGVMDKSHAGMEHHINGKKTNPEGYVIHHDNEPTKMVNRAEFAKANLLKVRK
jgi:hypothetical protein